MTSLQLTLLILGISIAVSFLYGLFTRNYSTVDRLWSILPAVYALIWMKDFMDNPRFIIATLLVCVWAIRLSWNFARKGGYDFNFKKGFTGEDYRWEILRERIPNRFIFEIFNLFFISGFQLVLIFAFTYPLYVMGQVDLPLNWIDYLLFAIHALLLLGEFVADIQQFNYYKNRESVEYKSSARHQLGFNTFGLWKHSRHPNYLCEMAQWIVVGLYAWRLGGEWVLMIGSLVLILLFIGSTGMAEGITNDKYPRYQEWRKVTVAWIGLPFLKAKRRKAFLDSIK